MVTYNLTAQEKENILKQHYFYSGDNTTIVELFNGTFNSNNQLAKSSGCGWVTQIGWNKCSSGKHDGSNFMSCEFSDDFMDDAGNPGTPPTSFTYSMYVDCGSTEPVTSYAPTNPGEQGGGSSSSGTGSNNNGNTGTPCIEAPTDPTDPSTGIGDDGGCQLGIPTLPNLGDKTTKTPCEKIKKVGKDPVTKNAMKNLKKPEVLNDNKEHAYLLWEDNFGDLHDDIYGTGPANSAGVRIQFEQGDKFSAFLHSHYQGPEMLSIFSFDDFVTLCTMIHFGSIKDIDSFVLGVVTAHNTQYMMVIDDPTKLANCASQLFVNGQYNEIFGDTYEHFFDDSVNYEKTIEGNENGLVNFLELQSIGLKLMKGDDQMENLQLLTKDANNNFTTINCN